MLARQNKLDENASVRSSARLASTLKGGGASGTQLGPVKPGAASVSTVQPSSAGPVKPSAVPVTTRRAFGDVTNANTGPVGGTSKGGKGADAGPVKVTTRVVVTAPPRAAPAPAAGFTSADFARVEHVPAMAEPLAFDTGLDFAAAFVAHARADAVAAAPPGAEPDFDLDGVVLGGDAPAGGVELVEFDLADLDF